MSFAHVGLDEVGRESDPRVTVADEMVDGLRHADCIVGRRRRYRESFDLVAGESDCLACRLQAIEVGLLGRRRNRDDAVQVIPCRGLGEVGGRYDLIAAKAGIECLDQDDTAANRGDSRAIPATMLP